MISRHSRLLASILGFSALLIAQSDNARLVGTVADTSGAVIPGASITVRNEKTGEERSAIANDQGTYVVTNLKAASYRVTGKGEGLGPAEYTNILLAAGQERTMN